MTRLSWLPAALTLALAGPAWGQDRGPVQGSAVAEVSFLDVGQGDGILIRSPEGKTALIDAGPSKAVVPLLRSRGVTTLDLVEVSHHHADHYGGMDDVIRAFGPRVYLATSSSHTTPGSLCRRPHPETLPSRQPQRNERRLAGPGPPQARRGQSRGREQLRPSPRPDACPAGPSGHPALADR
jgi:beta-lactamase superfamily II metal-dependent hydrolase